jgi:predicted esterase
MRYSLQRERRASYIFQDSPNDESSLLKAVQNVHATIYKEIAAGTNPDNVFVCGFSQGGISFIFRVYINVLVHVCTNFWSFPSH